MLLGKCWKFGKFLKHIWRIEKTLYFIKECKKYFKSGLRKTVWFKVDLHVPGDGRCSALFFPKMLKDTLVNSVPAEGWSSSHFKCKAEMRL